MEYALREIIEAMLQDLDTVLILVLMEYALRDFNNEVHRKQRSLNPCFNGICSARCCCMKKVALHVVLILVLMEYALREFMVG